MKWRHVNERTKSSNRESYMGAENFDFSDTDAGGYFDGDEPLAGGGSMAPPTRCLGS